MTNEQLQTALDDLFMTSGKLPFLFVGSGFSRRYIGLEDWKELLTKFSMGKYNYYKGKADNNLPTIASLIAEEFYDYWWNDDTYKTSVVQYGDHIDNRTSPLRVEISDYLKNNYMETLLQDELEILQVCNIEGVITTNWDLLLEKIFNNFKVYIGQEDLLFSNITNIGEIYKIHGCCTMPESLILTDSDYHLFNEKNAYLAAKLITIFVEHPILFIGYSLSDSNIRNILANIAGCLSNSNLSKLGQNLIFLKRGNQQGITNNIMQINEISLPITIIETNDFSIVYKSMSKLERKIPAHILRMCKEKLYEIIESNEPDKQLFLDPTEIDSLKSVEQLEFIAGIGVTSRLGEQGYIPISSNDLVIDSLLNKNKYNSTQLLENCICNPKNQLSKSTYLPIFKHLKTAGFENFSNNSHIKDIISSCSQKFELPHNAKAINDNELQQIFEDNGHKYGAIFTKINRSQFNISLLKSKLIENIDYFPKLKSTSRYGFIHLCTLIDFYENYHNE